MNPWLATRAVAHWALGMANHPARIRPGEVFGLMWDAVDLERRDSSIT